MRFPLPVEALRGVNVSRHFVDEKYRAGSFAAQDVPDGSVPFIGVGVELRREGGEQGVNTERRRLLPASEYDPGGLNV